MTSEQLEAARAERMRQNGHGALTLEDARTWLEETGLCLFLPKRQFSSALAPSFVEAIAGQRNVTPDSKQIAQAEEHLVRLENDGIAVRLNLLGQPGEQPDYVVAAWVLPYVYALRGDRDWRRSPQLTGSRQVSPLAIQAYKRLEIGEATIPELMQSLGHGVSEIAVLRAITELWQQLRIIPAVSAPGKPARWQLLKTRFQKAIAEGASTSQVTAISVLASIFLQAVIAAGMEEVEIFLSPLTARSKIREVLRGLVATRQVHTLSMSHATQYYVAGTLPEFTPPPTLYSSSAGSTYLSHLYGHEDILHAHEDIQPEPMTAPPANEAPVAHVSNGNGAHRPTPKPARPHHSRPASHAHDRKPARPAGRSATTGARWQNGAAKSLNGARNGNGSHATAARNGNGHATNGSGTAKSTDRSASGWPKRNASAGQKTGSRTAARVRPAASGRLDVRAAAKPAHGARKPALAGRSKRYGVAARQESKKRG
ncbi:MAG TPA: hypothetical protein VG267_18620 [Terracidiphilus sp.]|nr:hypothetical protein [Terracidiphilus sp.]